MIWQRVKSEILLRFLVVVIIFFPNIVLGQEYHVHIYDNQEYDIPSNNVRSILRDKEGYMWVGTDGGLVLYDGYQFQTFKDQLPSHFVKDILQIKNDDLLVATDLGVTSIHKSAQGVRFHNFLNGNIQLTDSTLYYPNNLFEDKNNELWIAEAKTIVRYHNQNIERYRFNEQFVHSNGIRSFLFAEDTYGRLIVASHSGYIFQYNTKKDAFEQLKIPIQTSEPDLRINSLRSQKDGWIWIGTNKGLYRWKPGKKRRFAQWQVINKTLNISSITKLEDNNAYVGTWLDGVYKVEINGKKISCKLINEVAHSSVNDVVRDYDDGAWIGTDHGFDLLKPNFFVYVKVQSRLNYVNSIHINKKGEVYKSDEYGVYNIRVSDKPPHFTIKNVVTSTNGNRYSSMCMYGDKFYVGSREGTVSIYQNKRLLKTVKLKKNDNRYIKFINVQDPDHIWISQEDSKSLALMDSTYNVTFYNSNKGIESNIHVIKSDSEGNVFAGGDGNGSYLYEYNPEKDIFVNMSVFLPDSLFSRKKNRIVVNDLAFGNNNDIYLATNIGLLKIIRKQGKWLGFDGILVSDYIKSVVVDNKSNIWLGTENGLYYYSEGQLTRYDKNDGLPAMNLSYHALVIDKLHHLWIGTSDGMAYSRQPINHLKKTPYPKIQGIYVNDRLVKANVSQGIQVTSNSKLRIKMSTLTYPTNNVHFKLSMSQLHGGVIYRMKNMDDDIFIPVNHLGKYVLRIKSYQSGYLWSNPVTMNLIVTRPWYARWWAALIYVIGFVFIGFITYRYQQSKIERDRKLRYFQRRDRMMKQVIDVMPIYVFIRDTEGRYLFSNKAHASLYGTIPEHIVGKKDEDFNNNEEDIQKVKTTDAKVLRAGKLFTYNDEFSDFTGKRINLQIIKLPYEFEQNQHDVILGVAIDISQLMKARQEVKQSEERFRILSDAAFEGIVISDEGKIIDTNKKILELTGYRREELIGKHSWNFVAVEERDKVSEKIWNEEHGSYETMILHKKGWKIPVEIYARVYYHNNKKLRITIIRDITDRLNSEKRLKDYAHKLEVSNKELEDFAYVVSHDLQEPLRKIQAFGDIFMNEQGVHLNEYGKFYIDRMTDAAKRMQNLINDLLDYSRITTKAKPHEPIHLKDIIKGVLNDLEFRLKETNAVVNLEKFPEVDADPVQMRQLFQNLISNALKFKKPEVTPVINISCDTFTINHYLNRTDDVDICRITVQDNGIGFDQKYAEKIFKVFERLHSRSEYEGSGMGLAICKKIVERHKGKISVNSKIGEGSTFIIELPCKHQGDELEIISYKKE